MTTWTPEPQRPPLKTMTAEQIVAELVADGVRRHPTELARLVTGVQIVARQTNRSVEDVFCDLHDQVMALTGHGLPVHAAA